MILLLFTPSDQSKSRLLRSICFFVIDLLRRHLTDMVEEARGVYTMSARG